MTSRSDISTVVPISGDQGVEDPALLISVAWARRWQSRHLCIEYAERARSMLSGQSGSKARANRARANVALAWQARWRGDFDEAMCLALDAEQGLSEAEYPCERAELYSILGVLHYSRNRLDLADGAVKRGLALMSENKTSNTVADLLTASAAIHVYAGDLRSAGEVLGKARKIATNETLARVEHNVARWMLADGAAQHALEHAQTSLVLGVAHQNNVILPYAHEIKGACLVELGAIEEAKQHFTKGLDLATKDNDPRCQCQIIGWFAGLEKKQDSLERARDLYRFGTEIAKRMNYTLWEKKFARNLADVYEGLGDLAKSVECHKRAWKLEEEKRL